MTDQPTDNDFVQRRNAFRLNTRLPVRIERPVKHTCQTVDLSVLGAYLDDSLPGVRIGDEIALVLELKNGEMVELDATVLRMEDMRGTAVVFQYVAQETMKTLERYIADEQRYILRVYSGMNR